MRTLKVYFSPEKRKGKDGKLISENVQLLAFISYYGRIKPFTGIKLNNINDFDEVRQKFIAGKKAKFGTMQLSATMVMEHLKSFEFKYYTAFKSLLEQGGFFSIKDIHAMVVGNKKVAPKKESEASNINASSLIKKVAQNHLSLGLIRQIRHSRYIYLANCIELYQELKNIKFRN